jgi:hypothetical protein
VVELALDRPEFSGKWTENLYYPSPEMHADAADALHAACAGLLEKATATS